MKESLYVSFIQSDIYWENPIANLCAFEEKIASFDREIDLFILPEMFNTGFSMNLSEPMNHTTHKWMKQMAAQYKMNVLGSLAITESKEKYNRALFVNHKAETQYYDKKHLFSLGNEHLKFSAGNKKTIVDIDGWHIKPLICYDLRFPVWCRNVNLETDVMVFMASWPKSRISHWKTLLTARAIENQCYVIGVNRLGLDGNKVDHNGQSMVIDFKGNVIVDAEENSGNFNAVLNKDELNNYRQKYAFYKDNDDFSISL
jgi:omega-amidase